MRRKFTAAEIVLLFIGLPFLLLLMVLCVIGIVLSIL